MHSTAALNTGNEHELMRKAEGLRERLVSIRRKIHARPEFGFREHETARRVAATLDELGARVR